MLSVAEALARVLALADPLGTEDIPLTEAAGRVLARDVLAGRNQPPFPASAMDGYAVAGRDHPPGTNFKIIGESTAGERFSGAVREGEAVRIFTGAPVPPGADRVIIQEDVARDGEDITLAVDADPGPYIRPAGHDFAAKDRLTAPQVLRPADISLLAAMNAGRVTVARRPVVAILSTGNELVQPGEDPGPDQIIASNSLGLKALFEENGAEVRRLPIAKDTEDSLRTAFHLAQGADLLVTTGGASVGDHDLVRPVAEALGMNTAFYKVAMRPGKPLMAGRVLDMPLIGLPGNPVSSMVCGVIFVLPLLRQMLGLPGDSGPTESLPLAQDLPRPNGPRAHYMRAQITPGGVVIEGRQDSGLLSVLQRANALALRPPHDPPRLKGAPIDLLRI